MTKVRQRASLPVDAVKLALEREHQKREDIKPIELLKVALSAYLAFTFNRGRRERDGRQDAPRVNRQRRPSPRNPGSGRPAALQRELLARRL